MTNRLKKPNPNAKNVEIGADEDFLWCPHGRKLEDECRCCRRPESARWRNMPRHHRVNLRLEPCPHIEHQDGIDLGCKYGCILFCQNKRCCPCICHKQANTETQICDVGFRENPNDPTESNSRREPTPMLSLPDIPTLEQMIKESKLVGSERNTRLPSANQDVCGGDNLESIIRAGNDTTRSQQTYATETSSALGDWNFDATPDGDKTQVASEQSRARESVRLSQRPQKYPTVESYNALELGNTQRDRTDRDRVYEHQSRESGNYR
ncbi:hypothetical protein H072_6756 [Dactylellina haptotyla CBS 200.50]|uniref:Uncharacterized protein n=1 Tax=Dactylellina haptotyla (strain CBS 200.50) TaxID=1284197 RepID=S8AEA8_DACHA|nr:hypothetical protein H072_6756 [Dactylellina haptotyla CBS 200.50]